ncbi:MAG: nucleotidyl transferase AbiEii/AbiGii toxin family protein [Candidatus Berkiella sp.]
MDHSIIQQRLKEANPQSLEEQTHILKETVQEIILYGLSTIQFFDKALFQGGTALRILYGLPRFSEDLDFIVKNPDEDFQWQFYMSGIQEICEEYGIVTTITDKSKTNKAIQSLFIKNDSIGKMLDLSFKHNIASSLLIKLEIDITPPLGSGSEIKFLDFPLLHRIEAQDLSSNFALKCHALLCRKYIKGRDWYDFLWYISKKIKPNLALLQNAIHQTGPWQGKKIQVTSEWLTKALTDKIQAMNWKETSEDVRRFLNTNDRKQLQLWGNELFLDRVEKLAKSYK